MLPAEGSIVAFLNRAGGRAGPGRRGGGGGARQEVGTGAVRRAP